MHPIQVTEPRAGSAARVLARAFQNDPGMAYIQPDPRRRAAGLPGIFAVLVRYALRFGAARQIGDPAHAVALWLPPAHPTATSQGLAELGLRSALGAWDLGARERLGALGEHVEAVRARLMPAPHARLFFVGVDPLMQGQGLGGAVIAPTLARFRDSGVPCYLETFAARNVPFYARHGFHVLDESRLPEGPLTVWAMCAGLPRPASMR